MSALYLILPPFACDCGVGVLLGSFSGVEGREFRRNCTCLECEGIIGEEVFLMCDPRREVSEREGEGGCSMVHICRIVEVVLGGLDGS